MSFPRTIPRCRTYGLLAMLLWCGIACGAPIERASWGAIASQGRWYGQAFGYATRTAAETEALAQCRRGAVRPASCAVRTYFDRSCGALAEGNFGEWGTATASTLDAARKSAAAQCDGHLPTEPCKVVASVCSPK